MALEDYRSMMLRCNRCTYCKWIPMDQIKSWRFSKGCPSIEFNKFQPYSAGGRLAASLSVIDKRSEISDKFIDIANNCLLCGSCEVSCKVCRYNMEQMEAFHELRFKLVENGQILPQHMQYIDHLRKEDNMMLEPKEDRGKWAEGLDVKHIPDDKTEVLFHSGCRFAYDKELQKVARTAVTLLRNAGVDIGIMGKDESCCGGRAYHWGYQGEFVKFAENAIEAWKTAGVKTIVTSCSDCFHSFTRLYPRLESHFEVLHTVQYLDRLIKAGKIKFTKKIPLLVTYHDPCHLGRQGEPYVPWDGKEKKIFGQAVVYDPPKPRYNGAQGVYDPPREILKSIPGLKFKEMERIREYAWCCGSGGGCKEAYPDFSKWTASERIEEAKSTGAEALVSACGWCERNFIDAIKTNNSNMKVYDIVELVQQAI